RSSRTHFSLQQNNPYGGKKDVSGNLSFNLHFGLQDDKISWQISDIDYSVALLDLSDKETGVAIEKLDILRRIKTMESTLPLAKKELETAKESFEFSTLSFQKGLISNIALLDSQDELTRARKDYIFLLIDYRLLQYEYYSVFGKDL
ncbi:TolC family protein, partial [Candidatus Riflebacteria bacterium]